MSISASVVYLLCFFSFLCCATFRDLHSFPTRRSSDLRPATPHGPRALEDRAAWPPRIADLARAIGHRFVAGRRSEEHTSELQSHSDLVCRLLLEKKTDEQPPPSRRRRPSREPVANQYA